MLHRATHVKPCSRVPAPIKTSKPSLVRHLGPPPPLPPGSLKKCICGRRALHLLITDAARSLACITATRRRGVRVASGIITSPFIVPSPTTNRGSRAGRSTTTSTGAAPSRSLRLRGRVVRGAAARELPGAGHAEDVSGVSVVQPSMYVVVPVSRSWWSRRERRCCAARPRVLSCGSGIAYLFLCKAVFVLVFRPIKDS